MTCARCGGGCLRRYMYCSIVAECLRGPSSQLCRSQSTPLLISIRIDIGIRWFFCNRGSYKYWRWALDSLNLEDPLEQQKRLAPPKLLLHPLQNDRSQDRSMAGPLPHRSRPSLWPASCSSTRGPVFVLRKRMLKDTVMRTAEVKGSA